MGNQSREKSEVTEACTVPSVKKQYLRAKWEGKGKMIVILLTSICDDMYRSAYTSVMILGVNLTRPQYLALWSNMSLDVSVESIV